MCKLSCRLKENSAPRMSLQIHVSAGDGRKVMNIAYFAGGPANLTWNAWLGFGLVLICKPLVGQLRTKRAWGDYLVRSLIVQRTRRRFWHNLCDINCRKGFGQSYRVMRFGSNCLMKCGCFAFPFSVKDVQSVSQYLEIKEITNKNETLYFVFMMQR